ncbi:tetratricopeptide repeat protein [Rhizobium sp. MC63]|uniref:Tetratricopeptide repeat protein n=1 Tax=Rhizobium mulingense TaxID=3031128 RepID=A0ACC6N6T1_9HYPH|nr:MULTISPECIES: tetratricopeptide repeat protein [unclassified Rhizobium]MDF0700407.1 tetratricopeptide repeat protein [Rhizobium sp. MC63]MEA3521108.1 tetratricopeptide repeat protein [Rhizobium sp. MJ31]
MRKVHFNRSIIAAASALAASVAFVAPVRADNPSILLDPPNLDYKAVCKPPTDQAPRPKLDRDWTKSAIGEIKLPARDIVALAVEYSRGSERVQKAPAVAEEMLRAGLKKYPAQDDIFLIPLARVLMENSSTIDELREAESYLLDAYGAGSIRAAFALGQLYGDDGPSEMRDLTKSRFYLEKSALAADPQGMIEYARIVTLDPQATEEQKKGAVTNALLGLIGQIKEGDCSALNRIGFLYLRGSLVSKEVETALKWLEAFARTGDPRTAQNLAELYRSNQVDQIDIQKSMTYLKQAADGGMSSAQFSLGKAYATGISVPQDSKLAIKYLSGASDAGLHPADEWLARIYAGEFGAGRDDAKAKEYFQRVMQAQDHSEEVPVQYGEFLASSGASKEDVNEALRILQAAADAGSADASDEIGKIYLEMGRKDPSYLSKAMQSFSEAATAGNSDGAAKLAGMFACGQGAPISVELANDWRHKAAIFGSVYSIYVSGLNMLTKADEADRAKGRVYLQQAAFKGSPEAIGYVVARWEAGTDSFEQNPEAAERLLRFVASLKDNEQRRLAQLSIISNRFDVASKLADKLSQIAALDSMIQADDRDALMLRAQLLQRAGQATPAALGDTYKKLAQLGDPRGMREYGKILLSDLSQNSETGRTWLKKAAEAGDFKAKISLIDPGDPQALQQLAKMTAAGEACTVDAMVNIARVYSTLPDPQAKTLARYWLSLAESLSDQDADDLYTVGAAFRDGIDGVESRAKAEGFFLRSYALGRISVLRDLAEGHLQGIWTDSSVDKAKADLLKLYAAGDKDAANKLISEIANERMVSNPAEVNELLTFLGTDVNAPGKYLLKIVRLNLEGKLGTRDDAMAIRWLTVSADAGEPNAMYRLYQAYFFGNGVAKDTAKAFDWLGKSGEAGNQRAARELSVAYKVGVVGLKPDADKAAYWDGKFKALSTAQ